MKSMPYFLIITLCALLCLNCSDKSTNPDDENLPSLEGWTLVWHDEFSKGDMPDTQRWYYEFGPYWYNNELQYYTNSRPENVRVENGLLILEARHEEYGGRNYTSTRLNSKQSWTYGRMELKARLPRGVALWPALWMMPVNDTYGGWPKSGEIDIMENWSWDPTGIYGTIHTEAYNHISDSQVGGRITVPGPWQKFYTYAIEWGPEKIDWFVDDSLYFTFVNEGTPAKWPFDHAFRFIINIAVEENAPGQEQTWEKRTMEVDYVRVYQKED